MTRIPTRPPLADLQFRLLVQSISDYAIYMLDPAGTVISWNVGAQRITGYGAEEIVGRNYAGFFTPEDQAAGTPAVDLVVALEAGRFEGEGWRVRKDGTRYWASVVVEPIYDLAGAFVSFAKITRDMTEKRAVLEDLRRSEQRLRLLVDSVVQYAIFTLSPEGRVTSWNAGAQRAKGYTRDEILGETYARFFTPQDQASGRPAQILAAAYRAGRFEDEGWRVRKDGTRFWASVVITAVRRDGIIIGYGKITRDLTERRIAQQRAIDDARRVAAEEAARRAAEERTNELHSLTDALRRQAKELETRTHDAEQARVRADEANRAKSQFLAAMSHELRTPLNAIGGFTDLIDLGLAGPVSATQHEHLERIRRSQVHLLGIINDILNFSRIEAGQLQYDLVPVPVQEVMTAVSQLIEPQAARKGVQFEVAECPTNVCALADRPKVEQILLNLLSNAMKFTEAKGSIIVSCRWQGRADVAFVVRDTGVGIPAEQLEAIFEPFVQVGRSLSSRQEGTGLGLAISRDLARGMAGDITVTSTVGEGSEFVVTLPRA
jgi:PAS domain S-box-containing protein